MSTPIEISGQVIGVERVVGRLSILAPTTATRRLRETVRVLGFELQHKVQIEKLRGQVLKRGTGALGRSINTKFTDTVTTSTATVGTKLRYGRIWELTGSRAFTIVPKNKKALFWKGAKHPVRSVLHPAQAPRPFLRPALDEMRPEIRVQLEQAMRGL